MKVWIGYECYDTGCDIFKSVEKIFADELDAMLWVDAFSGPTHEWREISERNVVESSTDS